MQYTIMNNIDSDTSCLAYPIANSSMLVFPIIAAPDDNSRWTAVAVYGGVKP